MASVSGLLHVGEASPTARAINARRAGSQSFYGIVAFVAILVGGLCGNLLARYVTHTDTLAATLFGFAVGIVVLRLFIQRIATARFRSRMAEKGHPLFLQLDLEITSEAIVYRIGDIQQSAPWRAVSELFEKRGYWIFLVQSVPFFAPKRFFENPAAEKAFVCAALERMSVDARDRSRAAAAFADGG